MIVFCADCVSLGFSISTYVGDNVLILYPLTYAVPGPNYDGEVVNPTLENSPSSRQIAVGVIGIIAVLSLAFMAIKD